MRIKKKLIIPVMALVAMLALGTGLFATGTISSIVGSSSSKPTFTEMPTAEQLENKLDYTPKVMEDFSNGYTFESATVGTEEGLDDQGNSIDKHKNLTVFYVNDGESMVLNISKWNSDMNTETPVAESYKEIDLKYLTYQNKCVPGDYQMTEQDKADEASGKYVFSYGVEKEEIDVVQHISWVENGIDYSILAINSPLNQADLIVMAKESIDQ